MLKKYRSGIGIEGWLLVAVAISVLLRVVYVGARELWYDEVLSLLLSTGQRLQYENPPNVPVPLARYAALLHLPTFSSPIDAIKTVKPLLQGLVGREPHPPLFFLSQYVWLFISGTSEAALRSLNALLGIGSLLGAYGMGRALLEHRGGLVMAALLGLNPFFWFHSLNLRMYGPTVLWVTLSGWAMLSLCYHPPRRWSRQVLSSLLLIGSVTAGLLTYYLFAYWVLALMLLVLVCDRRRWWQHGLRLAVAGLLAMPWYAWGLPQQLRNADFERFGEDLSGIETVLIHTQGVIEAIGINLLVGDWASGLSRPWLIAAGLIAIAGLVWMAAHLAARREQRLVPVLILGLVPISIALAADVVSGKFTLSWGEGRSVIFILPGLLLWMTLWLLRGSRQQRTAIAAVLIFYLAVTGADAVGRGRQMFHQVAAQVNSDSTLVVLNSKAWGHVLRLAYYLPVEAKIDLLATNPAALPDSLPSALTTAAYDRILWLEAANPLWQAPETAAEAAQIRQSVDQLLTDQYRLQSQSTLTGTMLLDRFSLSTYDRP
ncbi:glycosyltransferase family 39 protein [Romeria aff. gracilis LEGE 07310]|uniref:Glycosyltransferase family 39 protein n=1 Tax=Vasconcelosia minhoensis LEGE 07310 TaxID=915328 RepID=A0A8J7DMG8_9CYAN|nr:glycosyltransferase family 39 protein [Romeria gracilis]MBE9078711.1 glycosyltransferase family 39 protein [Romeria aff. gracilis LEGE 07310]